MKSKEIINSLPIGLQETLSKALAGEKSYLVKVLDCGCKYLSEDYGFHYKLLESCTRHRKD